MREEEIRYTYLPVAQRSLQGLADGSFGNAEIYRLEALIESQGATNPFLTISRALVAADRDKQIEAPNLADEPIALLTEPDRVLIRGIYEGNNINSQIMKNLDWSLEELQQHRQRVWKALGAVNDYQVALWESRQLRKAGKITLGE